MAFKNRPACAGRKFNITAKKILSKLTIMALVFLFAFQPIAPAFAQNNIEAPVLTENGVEPADDAADTTEDIVPPAESLPDENVNPDAVAETTTEEESEPEQPEASSSAGDNHAQSDSLTKQNFPEIDKNTGALSYNFSVSVPPGRNNFQPNLNFSYNSSSNSQNSIFGYGWSLSIPYIQRLSKNGVDKLYDAAAISYFYSSLDGELIHEGGSLYIPRTENGSFNKYTFSNNQWLVTTKDGKQYKFGYNESSQQNDPANPGNVYKWMLEETKDTNDNYISYSYFKDAGQIYPLAIKYTGNGTDDGIFRIDFSREENPDVVGDYNTGFFVATNYRINQITSSANGNWTNKYVLSYFLSQNTNRSLLKSITASGKNSEENITTLPPTTFDYQSVNEGWNLQNTFWSLPAAPAGVEWDYTSMPPQFADLNGDGLPDLVMTGRTNIGLKDFEYINNGHGWNPPDSSWNIPPAPEGNWNLDSKRPQFVDLNGDGLTDLVMIAYGCFQIENNSFCLYRNHQYLNTGSGWTKTSLWEFPSLPAGETSWQWKNIYPQFADINGDGLTDIILVSYRFISQAVGGVLKDYEYINNGNGWTKADDSFHYPLAPEGYEWDLRSRPPQFADLNGDGLPDLSIFGREKNNPLGNRIKDFQYLNTGNGWVQTSVWNFPTTLPAGETDWRYPDVSPQFTDLNGDGLIDIVLGAGHHSVGNTFLTYYRYLNNGTGWTQTSLWKFPPLPAGETDWQYSNTPPQFTDLNSEDLADLILVASHNYGYNNVYTCYGYINNGQKQDLLSQINYPQGGNATISYKASTQYVDDSGNIANKAPYPIFTVSQIINSDEFGNNITSSYKYTGGYYYYNNPFDRQFSGYNLVEQTDAAGYVTKTYYHTANTSDSSLGEYQDNYFKIGKPYRVEKYDVSGNLYQVSINKWDSYDLGNGAGFAKLIQTIEKNYDGQSISKDKAESYEYENNNGNLSQKIEWGEVLASDDGSFSDIGSDKHITSLDYASSSGSRVEGSPSAVIFYNQNSDKISETRYYYDNLALGSISLGNQTKEEKWVSGVNYINTQKIYNNFGLVTQSKDANGNPINYIYDNYGLYPTSVTNALNQTTQYVYSYASGKIIQATDPNGSVLKNTYDGFARILKTEQPDETSPATLVIKTFYAYNDVPGAVNVRQINYLDSLNAVDAYNYYDGLGRLLQSKKSAESNNFSTKDFIYDNRGNLQKESLPYFSNTLARTAPTSTSQLYTTYAYDTLNRKISETNAIGATSFAYRNWQTTITDANGKQKDFIYDAYNNLVQVKEHNRANIYTTNYAYDGMGNLTNITDALGNVRNFAYDGLARRLSAQDLHNSADPVFGLWKYFYDSNGNLTRLANPNGQIITYSYDVLNRKISENYTAVGGIELVLNYDDCKNGIGGLCGAVSNSLTEQYEYSPTGNITKESKKIGIKNFVTEYAFDRQQNQTLIINPDGSQIKYEYNLAGLAEKVFQKELSDADFKIVVSNFDYSPAGQIANIVYSNGTQTTNTYDQNQLYRLTKKLSSANGINLQDISYQYDNVGNIKQIIDNSATDTRKTVNYTYDDLYRLTSAVAVNTTNTQDYTESFVYDAIGNILSKKINGEKINYRYKGNLNNTGSDYANPDAATETEGDILTSYKYDRNGNMTGQGLNIYKYDYNNRLVSAAIQQASSKDNEDKITRAVSSYSYDRNGQRVKTSISGENPGGVYYPTMYYNISSEGETTKHVFANNLDIATIEGSGADAVIYFNLADQLQSSNVITDSTGAIVETMDYYPFGKIRTDIKVEGYSEQRKYIGQEYDEATGLNYLNARYYNADLARFTSQDPMFWNFDGSWLADPQNQNAYAYARNNPITLSDPSGEKVWIESKSVFNVRGNAIGIHTYLKAVPDNPNEINIQGLSQGAEGFTMGGYNSSNFGPTNKLIKNMGTTETSWDKDTAFGDGTKINSMEINPPEGQNDTQFINNLGKIYNETDLSGMNYFFHGKVDLPGGFTLYDGNCNNFSYTLGVKAGVKDQMDAFIPDPGKTAFGGAPGYYQQLPTETLYQQIQGRVNLMKEKVNNYIFSLFKNK